ncbi:MAG: serine/threonine-protein kinase, partial [Planctomycetota bacterium]
MKQEAGPPESDSLTRALEEYLAEIEAGRAPSRDAFLRRYPDLSAELAPCLTALDFVQGPLAAESAPRTLGDFEIVREIGRGGMGVVYEAEQISLRRRVALKMLPFAGMLDPRQLQRFRNEAQAAAHLHHTNIVPVHSVGHERGVHFYAMQYIDGVSVAEMIEMLRATAGRDEPRSGSSSAALEAVTKGHGTNSADYCRNVARLGVQAAEALHHAHRQGIVHRDIKPANLIIDREGRIWITDFGLASFRDQRELTMTGDLVGTVRYMSPEQTLAKQMPVDHRTDVYSLGVTLHELVTLEHAFAGENAAKVLQEIAVKEPPHASRINPAVPQELETILLKAMSKLPEDRYATAEEMADDLNRFLEDRPIRARRPTVLKLAGHWSRRHKSVVWASLVVLLLAIAGLASATVVIAGERDRAEQGWQQAEAEGLRTRRHYNLARNALERTLGEVEQALLVYPRMTPSQESLLNEASRFYEGYLREAARDGGNRMEIALAHDGVARILSLFGDDETAGPRFERALDLYDELWREQPGDRGLGAELTRALIRGGRCWARRKDWPRAQEALTAAVDLARRQVAAHPGPETTLL